MSNVKKKYRRSFRTLIFMALLFFCNTAYPQDRTDNDTIIRISPGTFIHIRDSISFFSGDTLLRLPYSLIPATTIKRDKNLMFFDSLKAKASKNMLTRKLYDIVIVSPGRIEKKRITGTSDASYISYSGKKILVKI